MSAIHLLVYGPIALAVLSLALVRLLVRPRLKMPDGRSFKVSAFKAGEINYDQRNVYVLKGPK